MTDKVYAGQIYSHQKLSMAHPERVWLNSWMDNRLAHNKNVLALLVGSTGSGKSYSALSIAEMRDPDFDIDNVVFNTKDFLNLVKTQSKGSVNIYDDAGLGVSSKDWYLDQVKVFGKIVQSYRYRNLITLMTTPDLMFIETTSRTLINILFQSDDVYQGLFYPKLPYKPRNYSLKYSNTYFAYPRVLIDGIKYKLNRIYFPMPSSRIVDAYEKRRSEYIEAFYNEYEKELSHKKDIEVKRKVSPNSLANLKQYRKIENN